MIAYLLDIEADEYVTSVTMALPKFANRPRGATPSERAWFIDFLGDGSEAAVMRRAREHTRRFAALSEEELDEFWALADAQPSDFPVVTARPARFSDRDGVGRWFAALDIPKRGFWLASGHLVLDGQAALFDLALEPDPTFPASVDATLLRAIPHAQIRERALARLRALPSWLDFEARVGWSKPSAADRDTAATLAISPAAASKRRGRPPLPDEHYQEVARAYREALRAGSKGVNDRLSRRFGRPKETIRDWVREARARGHLPTGSQGRAG
jgi:hypothetical protein